MSLNGSSGKHIFRSISGRNSSWETKLFVIAEEHNVEVTFPLYQPLQKIFYSVDSVK